MTELRRLIHVTDTFVPRQLSFQDDREKIFIDAVGALDDPRLTGRPLIVLGEAGSGKSELLRHWSRNEAATARQVINGWRSPQGRSFVDGLDEAAGLKEGDALDRVLGALEAQRNTEFVLACRVADWRSASGVEAIRRWTGVTPIELEIEPLGRAEIIQFLQAQTGSQRAKAGDFVDHYEWHGLGEWLGNPQTLQMLARVEQSGSLPEEVGTLFKQYVDLAWREHRKQAGPLFGAARSEVLDALGALFAALIIGGYDALTVAPGADRLPDDLPLGECGQLPRIATISADKIYDFLNSRLVGPAGADRFTYQHRRTGEYLAARWLAGRATTRELRTRLLGALRYGTIVPSNLRGLWGWLADYEPFTADIIGVDPLAVIEYGNADTLGAGAARALLAALECAEDQHQDFGWRDYHAASLVQPELAGDVERVLAVPGQARFWTQFILLRQMRDPATVTRHAATLRALMLDEARPYAIRDTAADALADHGALPDWPTLIGQLIQGRKRDSLRLALVMMCNSNVGLTVSDGDFAETVYAYSGLTPRFAGAREVGTVALYHLGRRQPIADERVDGVLDAMAAGADRYLNDRDLIDAWDVRRLFCALLERRLALGPVDPDRLWRWLVAGVDDHGGTREARERIDTWLKANESTRRALQRRALESSVDEARPLFRQLSEPADLSPTLEDVVALLEWLPEADHHWRELIRYAPPREEGEAARRAAARHVRTEEDRQLLRNHADPPVQEWEKDRAQRLADHKVERAARRADHRANYLAARDRMCRGDYGALVGPAQVYMGRTHEVESGLAPERRIADWIGDDLQAAAFAGFELFLTADPPRPTATEIAEGHAKSRSWSAASIVVAALDQRLRTARGLADLTDERVEAGLLELVAGLWHGDEWKPLHSALAGDLERRGIWERYARLLIEPQLKHRRNYCTGLWEVLASPVGASLAADWLRAFPRIAAEPEEELIDHLLREGSAASRAELIEIAARRRRMATLDERRRRNWQAVDLIAGIAPPAKLAAIAADDRDFLWVLRNRMGGRRGNRAIIAPSPALLAATVAAFAPQYPSASMPSGVQMGDDNPWNASEFLIGCLDTLAGDALAEAGAALATLASIDNGYAWKIGRSIADQHRANANTEWKPYPVNALAKLVTDGPPFDHTDLQRVLLAELDAIQAQITSSDTDIKDLFYAGNSPKTEEPCSNTLIEQLRKTDRPLTFTPEPHMGGNRKGDILCKSESLAVLVECKRHWHPDLWTAFDWQLAQQQAVDWRARGYGVYIVYWFGEHVHALTGPPRGSGIAKPKTPEALEAALCRCVADAGLPGIAVKVLDVSRRA